MGSNRNMKRSISSCRSARTGRNSYASSDDEPSVPGTATYTIRDDGSFTQEPKLPRRRRRFTPTRRTEVANVRKVGACDYCRSKKIRCKHALSKTNQPESPSTSKASPSAGVDFESTHPDLYLSNLSADLLHPDVGRRKSLPEGMDSMESADYMIRSIPTPAIHSDRIALEMHDFDSIFGEYSGSALSETPFPEPTAWSTPYQTSALSEPEVFMSEPSSTSDNTYFSSLSPSSPTAASDNDSVLTYQQTAQTYHCEVPGCDFNHTFAHEVHLRQHQESRHPHLYPAIVTFTCPVFGCRHQTWPFVQEEKLWEHIRLNHSDQFQECKVIPNAESGIVDPLRLGKKRQVEKYLASEYLPGMNSELLAFPARTRLPGENMPFMYANGRETTSSRGRGSGIRKRRTSRTTALIRNATAPSISIQRQSPPSRNLEMDWSNASLASAMSPANIMNSLPGVTPNQFSHGNSSAMEFTSMSGSMQEYNPSPQSQGQLRGPLSAQAISPHVSENHFGPREDSSVSQRFSIPPQFQFRYPGQLSSGEFQQPPVIRVRPPTFDDSSPAGIQSFSSMVPPNPGQPVSMASGNTHRTESFTRHNMSMDGLSYTGGQRYSFIGTQHASGQDWTGTNDVNLDDMFSGSEFEHISQYTPIDEGSVMFSSPASELAGNRRTSLSSLNQVVNETSPATPSMVYGSHSLSSSGPPDASPLAEAPIPDSGVGDFNLGKYPYDMNLNIDDMFGEDMGLYDLDRFMPGRV